MERAESLADAVRSQRGEVLRAKQALRDQRKVLQSAAARLAQLEQKCAKAGIGFVR